MEDHNLFLPPRWGIALQMLILTAAGFQIRLNGEEGVHAGVRLAAAGAYAGDARVKKHLRKS